MTETQDRKDGEPPVTDLLFGLSEQMDEEGRPLGERRASSAAKIGIELVLTACPYHDSRRGQPMNVSALAQLTKHLGGVLTDITALRQTLAPARDASWQGVFQVIIDLLFAPGRFWIERRTQGLPVTRLRAADAVSHKLAAGYFGALYGILREELSGTPHPFSADHFLSHVAASRALHGASEVCAGPPAMIDRVTRVLFAPMATQPAPDFSFREHTSSLISEQLIRGLEFQVLDAALERRLFDVLGEKPTARNAFIEKQYTARRAELDPAPISPRPSIGPRGAPLAAFTSLEGLLSDGCGALVARPEQLPPVLSIAATLVQSYRDLVVQQCHLERKLRLALGLPAAPLRSRNGLILPQSKTIRWLEALAGASLRHDDGLGLKLHRVRGAIVNLTPTLEEEVA